MASILGTIESILADTLADNATVIQVEVLKLWDTYGEPYDIPGVPAVLEKPIDASIRKAIIAALPKIVANFVAKLKAAAEEANKPTTNDALTS